MGESRGGRSKKRVIIGGEGLMESMRGEDLNESMNVLIGYETLFSRHATPTLTNFWLI